MFAKYFDGPVIEEEVRRLLHFGSCVRSLGRPMYTWRYRSGHNGYRLGDRVCLVIACALAGRPLLPNLKDLMLHFESKWDDPALLHLIHSPQLQSVYLSASREFSKIDDITLFVQRHANAPNMRVLTIDCLSRLPVVQTSTSFQNLAQLTLSTKPSRPIPTSVIHQWSTLKNLKWISLETGGFKSTSDRPTTKPCFGSLEILRLDCPLDAAATFLSTATFPVLSQFSFNLMLPKSPNSQVYPWTRMLEALRSGTSSHFQELYIKLWDDSTPECTLRNTRFTASYPGVPFADLEPILLQFKFVTFATHLPLLQPLALEDVLKIRDAWPEIETLVLEMLHTVEPQLDLTVLKLFSDQSCESLRDLYLVVDAADIPRPKKIRSTHRLESLGLYLKNWENSLENQGYLASFIDSLFPHLADMDFQTPHAEKLEDVAFIIETIRIGRRRERRFHNPDDYFSTDDDDEILSD
ncbi:hypothetical protein CVT24_009554 [Panaeolus cyanescens]|uniref:F-box domain-containing protein n=1 Tax=Panaeolus cyanescens TaxID=181874 RepID=A0A409YAE2_9AGAR|nr:hypothetical protein CVT24_009554 [Panaeolus cyanescens]